MGTYIRRQWIPASIKNKNNQWSYTLTMPNNTTKRSNADHIRNRDSTSMTPAEDLPREHIEQNTSSTEATTSEIFAPEIMW